MGVEMLAGKSATITEQIDINQAHHQCLLPRAHSSQARSAIQCQTPAVVADDRGAGELERAPCQRWHQSSCYTFPSAARFTLSPISLALSLSETALSHLHHPACALRRAAYRCLSCQTPAAKLQQALRARPNCFRRALHNNAALHSHWYVLRAVVVRGLRAFVAPQPSPPGPPSPR